jgi:leucyl aminopeptidase
MFCNDDALAHGIEAAAAKVHDPVWRMPLHRSYAKLIESKVADIANSGGTPHAGAITAALFLERFVPERTPWAHFDIMAWNPRDRPGRPEGGEAMAMRAVFAYLESRFGASR